MRARNRCLFLSLKDEVCSPLLNLSLDLPLNAYKNLDLSNELEKAPILPFAHARQPGHADWSDLGSPCELEFSREL